MNPEDRRWTGRALGVLSGLLVTLALAVSAFGQAGTGQVTVKVTDPQGAAVSKATVTAKSTSTGLTKNATTNEIGVAILVDLPPGKYDVTASASGFADATGSIEVTVGAKSELPLSFTRAQAKSAVITVVGEGGVEVNTQSQELSTVISSTQLQDLPTLTRNPYDFVELSGNVNSNLGGDNSGGAGATMRGVGFSMNGQRSASTNILLDGGENVDYFTATQGQTVPLDSVQEYRIVTSDFTAEYGRASGGVVDLTTKSGTNSFHGSLYEYNRISALASNTFFNNANGNPRGVFTRNQFGYSIGGPVKKDKIFFFSNTEWIRIRSSSLVAVTVPTPQLLAASNAATQQFFGAYQLKTPINGQIFTVSDVLNSGAAATGAFKGLPGSMPAFGVVNYNAPADVGAGSPENEVESVNRVDFNITDNTQLYGRYAFTRATLQAGTINTSPFVGFDTGETDFDQNYEANLTHSFSPTIISQSKLTYNRLNTLQPLSTAAVGPTLYLTGTGSNNAIGGIPLAFPGYSEFTPGNAIPFGGPQNIIQGAEDMSYTRGNHQFKFGGEVIYLQDNRAFGAYEEAVELLGKNVGAGLDNLVNGQLFTFEAAVDPQGKFPGQTITLPAGPPSFTRSFRYRDYALYAQDSWHVKPRLTLNLGLRYEYFGTQHNNKPGLDSNFYFGSGSTIQQQIRNGSVQIAQNSPVGALWASNPLNFAPRVGFAWDVFGDGSTAVRGGYGIAFERDFGNVTFNVIQNPPNYAVVALVAPTDVAQIPVTLSNAGPLSGTGLKRLPVTSLRAVNPNIDTAYAHTFSFSVERKVPGRTVVKAEYSGARGENQYSIANVNRPGSGLVYLGTTDPNPLAQSPSRLNGQFSSINFRNANGRSVYDGLTLSAENAGIEKMGLQFKAYYTLAWTKDELSSTFSEDSANFNLGYLDPFNPSLDFGYADYDIRNRFAGDVIWDVPFARETKGVLRQIADGWSLQGIFTARSGIPFSVYDCSTAFSVCARLTPGSGAVLSHTGGALLPQAGIPDYYSFIDLSQSNPVPTANGPTQSADFGPYNPNMTKRNSFRGPGAWYLDAAIHKDFKFSETKSLQFRCEAYNVFNHANLFVHGGLADVSSSTFVPAFFNGNRNVQMALRFQF